MPHVNKQMASFFLTSKCNLSCIYCYNQEERAKIKHQSLPLHIAKAGVDYFFKSNSSRHIRFYGPGEPTQEFLLMRNIVDYARGKSDKPITVELQTNGCFGKNVRDWLLENINIIWVSFDGEPEIQNINRPFANGKPSAPVIEKNVKWLIENSTNKNFMVGARVTITDLNVNRQKEIIDYFRNLGVKYIWNDPQFPSVDKIAVINDKNKLENFNFDMMNYANKYIEAYHYSKDKDVFYGSFLTCNFDGFCNQHCRSCTPVPHFTTDGYISACDLVTFGEDPGHMDCFVYGKWNQKKQSFDIDYSKVKALQERTTDNMPHCQGCIAENHCGGYCLGEVKNETGNLLGQKKATCIAIKLIAKNIGFTNTPYPYLHP